MEGYREKIEDIRAVISMLVKINDNLCSEVLILQEKLAEQERINNELMKRNTITEQLAEKLDNMTEALTKVNEKSGKDIRQAIGSSEESVKNKIKDSYNGLNNAIELRNEAIELTSNCIIRIEKKINTVLAVSDTSAPEAEACAITENAPENSTSSEAVENNAEVNSKTDNTGETRIDGNGIPDF